MHKVKGRWWTSGIHDGIFFYQRSNSHRKVLYMQLFALAVCVDWRKCWQTINLRKNRGELWWLEVSRWPSLWVAGPLVLVSTTQIPKLCSALRRRRIFNIFEGNSELHIAEGGNTVSDNCETIVIKFSGLNCLINGSVKYLFWLRSAAKKLLRPKGRRKPRQFGNLCFSGKSCRIKLFSLFVVK